MEDHVRFEGMPENNYVVLITDYAWLDLRVEEEILSPLGAKVISADADQDKLLKLAPDAHIILINWKDVGSEVVRAARRCLALARYGIGLDNIAVDTATEEGILVTNVPAFCVEEVSDHTLALLLACARKLTTFDRTVKSGGTYSMQSGMPMYRLRGKTLGLVGLGKIAQALARKVQPLGFRLIAYSPNVPAEVASSAGVELTEFEDLLSEADFITIHTPLTESSRNLFNRDAFAQMKPTAFLINTARGAIVDSKALLNALDEGRLAGAGLDVLPEEPPRPDDPLPRHPKVIATPHSAFASVESIQDLRVTTSRQAAQVLQGKIPHDIVNGDVLEQENCRLHRNQCHERV